jgi:hypothetical protein
VNAANGSPQVLGDAVQVLQNGAVGDDQLASAVSVQTRGRERCASLKVPRVRAERKRRDEPRRERHVDRDLDRTVRL